MKNFLRISRSFVGIWGQLRRLVVLLEWNLQMGLRVETPWGAFIVNGSVPPTKKQIKEALKEEREARELVPEEERAAERLMEIYRSKAKGTDLEPDDPARDYTPY